MTDDKTAVLNSGHVCVIFKEPVGGRLENEYQFNWPVRPVKLSFSMSASLSRLLAALRRTGSSYVLSGGPVKNRCIREIRTKVPLTTRRCSRSPLASFPFRLRPCIVSVGYRYGFCPVRVDSKRNFCSVASETARKKMPEATKPFQRLPRTVKPVHYALDLVPDFKTLTFKGDVSIKIEVGLTSLGSICRQLFFETVQTTPSPYHRLGPQTLNL